MKELKAWLAMDKERKLFLYLDKPQKYKSEWCPDSGFYLARFPQELFPEVKWEDEEPTEVTITVKNNMENSKLKSALSFFGRIGLFVFIIWGTVVGIVHVILSWVFVEITAVFEILTGGFNLSTTKIYAKYMATPMDLISFITNFIGSARKFTRR